MYETITEKDIRLLLNLRGRCNYNATNKRKFARLSTLLLNTLALSLGLKDYDVRFNAGGIAVSGEATLHGESIYVQVSADTDLGILYRTCKGRKDYSGGHNNWHPWQALETSGAAGLHASITRLLERSK